MESKYGYLANKKINPLMERIKEEFPRKLQLLYSVSPEEASDKQVYHVLSSIIVEILGAKRQSFINHTHSVGGKQIYLPFNGIPHGTFT